MGFDVLDASAFYAGIPFASSQKHHTTPQVFDEIRHIKAGYGGIEALLDVGRLIVMEPPRDMVLRVQQTVKKAGETGKLSDADISVIALCAEHSGSLVSDDYAVSNIAKIMGLRVVPVMSAGTRRLKQWIRYCPSCKRKLQSEARCSVCGGEARRYPKFVG